MLLFLACLASFCFPLPSATSGQVLGTGTLLISSYFPLSTTIVNNGTTETKIHVQSGVMSAEALKYAVQQINNDSSILHGYKLRPYVQESSTIAVGIVTDFLQGSFGEIGPGGSEEAFVASILARSFLMPIISYYAGYPDVRVDRPTDFFFRTVPSDLYRVQATLDILQRLHWTYVGVVSSYGNDGERSARLFNGLLNSIDSCLAVEKSFSRFPSESDFDDMVLQMNEVKAMKAIVLFTTHKDSREFLRALKRNHLSDRFHLVAFYGFTGYEDVVEGLEEQAHGTISIQVKTRKVKGFQSYMLAQKPRNNGEPYFHAFWESVFQCSLIDNITKPLCPENATLALGRGYYPHTPIEPVVGAVYGLATAIGRVIETWCSSRNTTKGNCNFDVTDLSPHAKNLRNELRRMSFPDGTLNVSVPWMNGWRSDEVAFDVWNYGRDKQGRSRNNKIGLWTSERTDKNKEDAVLYARGWNKAKLEMDVSKLQFKTGTSGYGLAVCSQPCTTGSRRLRDAHPDRRKCCWTCRQCPLNDIVYNDTCVSCGVDALPSNDRTLCAHRAERFLHITNSSYAQVLIGICGFGLMMALLVTCVFLRFNDSRIVKASGRDLSYFLLAGIAACFLTPIWYVLRPSVHVCGAREIMPGFAFILCYAPLFLKTNRIYRIFRGAQVSVSRPPLISPQSQIVILTAILLMQALIGTVWMVSQPPSLIKRPASTGQGLWILCKDQMFPHFLNLGMSLVFMISCTWMAFKTRNFPKNFNEAKYIGFTMYITCICWALFLPTYIVMPTQQGFLRQTLMAMLCALIGFITLLGLFGHRVKLLLLPATVELHAQGQVFNTSKGSRKSSNPPHLIVLNNGNIDKDFESSLSAEPAVVCKPSGDNARSISQSSI